MNLQKENHCRVIWSDNPRQAETKAECRLKNNQTAEMNGAALQTRGMQVNKQVHQNSCERFCEQHTASSQGNKCEVPIQYTMVTSTLIRKH